MMYHRDLSNEVKRRLTPNRANIEFIDLEFRQKLDEVLQYCRANWHGMAGHKDFP